MVRSFVTYSGNKHCLLEHEPSGSQIETDAPKDNQGLGQAFSPTDLMAAALSSCAITTMAIVGEKSGIDLSGVRASVEKHMESNPRRIGQLVLDISLPARLDSNQRSFMEETARGCPVLRSLSSEIIVKISFTYF